MPFDDWQFYVVTLVAFVGAVALVRALLPSKKDGPGCPTCVSPSTHKRKTKLTVEGQRPE